jgi:hypothetical protein
MTIYQEYIKKFIADYKNGIINNDYPPNLPENLVPKIVQIPSTKSGFRIIGIRKFTPQENGGKHNLFMEVVDENGNRHKNVYIEWGWEGQLPNQESRPILLDKPENEAYGNIVIWANQTIWAEVKSVNGKEVESDRIVNVNTRLPDEAPGNTYGHHSFFVVWQDVSEVATEPTPDTSAKEAMAKIKVIVDKYFGS